LDNKNSNEICQELDIQTNGPGPFYLDNREFIHLVLPKSIGKTFHPIQLALTDCHHVFMEVRKMFDDLIFGFQRRFLQNYLKKSRAYYKKDQEKYLLKVFRRYASSVPAYKNLLQEKGVAPESITSVDAFKRLAPIIDKYDTFIKYEGRISNLCVDGKLGDIVSILSSSGFSGRFSYGLISKAEDKADGNLLDLYLDQRFHIEERRTLLINCLPMGVAVPSRRTVKGDVSVRPDMAIALVRGFGKDFDQILMIGENTFMKHTLELGLENGIHWPDYNVRLIVGEETFPETYRTYMASLLGKDIDMADEVIIGSSMGISEIGLSVFQESPDTIKVRRKIDARPELRKKYFGDIGFTPMIFNYIPMVVYIEEHKNPGDDFPEFIFTPLSLKRRLPLIRYNSHDKGMHIDPDENLEKEITTNLPMVAIFGRGDHIETAGTRIYVEEIKEMIYSDMAFAGQVTGNFILPPGVHAQKPVPLRIQLKNGIAPSSQIKKKAEELISRHFGDRLRAELVEFEGMPLDFERKLPYLGSI
jgi:phenylacetate-CoA ligase